MHETSGLEGEPRTGGLQRTLGGEEELEGLMAKVSFA